MVDNGSKYGKIAFLKDKTAESVNEALKVFFRDERERPRVMQIDNGKEFKN